MSALTQLDENLWVVDRPLSFFGLPLGTRMSVVRLSTGQLWLHSPVTLDPELCAQLDRLGPRFHFGPSAARSTRLLMRLLGAYGRLGPTAVDRFLVRDRAAAGESLERILAWDFERVVVTHGDVVETGGKQKLRNGYAWLLAR